MRDPAWLDDLDDLDDVDDPDDHGSTGRRRPLLALLAAVPWMVVVALLVVPGRQGNPTPEPLDTAAGVAEDQAAVAEDQAAVAEDEAAVADLVPHGADVESDTPGAVIADGRPDPDRAATEADLAAIAILAARSWLSGADPHDDDVVAPRPGEATYAEHLHLEGLEGEGDLVVARVVALLLDVDTAAAPRLQRIAVPLATTRDGPRLLGTPWELPGPAVDRTALATEPVSDPELAAAAEQALHRAGFTDPRIVGLGRTAGWPLVVHFSADGRADQRHLWLRTLSDGRLEVAGLADRAAPVPDIATDDDRIENAGEPS